MTRNVVVDNPNLDASAFERGVVGAMKLAFPDAWVTGHENLVEAMDNHVKDRHVAAAAIHAGAAAIVTYNLRDFRGEKLRLGGVQIVSPPSVVAGLLAEDPSVVAMTIESMSARKFRPPMSVHQVIAAIIRQQGFAPLEAGLGALFR